jgi:TPR repeat protein
MGRGCTRDLVAAGEYFRKAAEAGHVDGMYRCAIWMVIGMVAEPEKPRGVQILKMLADQGHQQAVLDFALCLEYGVGVEKNEEEAQRYMNMTDDQQAYHMEIIYGLGEKAEVEELVGYWRIALEMGYVEAKYSLGIGMVEKGVMAGCQHLKVAAQRGHLRAKEALAEKCPPEMADEL